MGIVLQGGTVVTAADCYRADIRMENEKITAVGQGVRQSGDRAVDANGLLLFPGGVDVHTHFDLPAGGTVTADDFASGTLAAVSGGTTTVIDYATQFRGESLQDVFRNWQAKAAGKSHADYGFHMAITDWNEAVAAEVPWLVRQAGITSVKLYMAYKNILQVDDGTLLKVLQRSRECGALVCLHCENGDIIDELVGQFLRQGHTGPAFHPLSRPAAAEAEAVGRAAALARVAGAPVYIVHLSSGDALKVVAEARRRGERVYAETCPQYLLLDDGLYGADGFEAAKYVLSPPLRSPADQRELWNALADGLIDTVATDHCSFNFSGQKEAGRDDFSRIPNGLPGVEHRFGLLYTGGVAAGRLTPQDFVRLVATRPAQLFGLYPCKGTIAPGSDADIVAWDPGHEGVITAAAQRQRVDYTPFEGFRTLGRAVQVFIRGRQVVRDGAPAGPPAGIYLPRRPFPAGRV